MKKYLTVILLFMSVFCVGQTKKAMKEQEKAFKAIRKSYGDNQTFKQSDTIRLELSKQTAYYYDRQHAQFVQSAQALSDNSGSATFRLYDKSLIFYVGSAAEYHHFQIKSQGEGINSEGEKFVRLRLQENANQAELLIYDKWVELIYLYQANVFLIEYM